MTPFLQKMKWLPKCVGTWLRTAFGWVFSIRSLGAGYVVLTIGLLALILSWVGVWDLIDKAFEAVRRADFSQLNAGQQVEAFRNLLWGVSFAAAGIVAVVGLVFAGVRTHSLNRQAAAQTHQAETQTAQAETDTVRLEYDTFTKCIEQLGSDQFAVRLGAILALENLAQRSDRLHKPVMEAFCAYVREHRPRAPSREADLLREAERREDLSKPDEATRFPADLQAILTAIGRRSTVGQREDPQIDLRRADLRGCNFAHANLASADLTSADLSGSRLWFADLSGASLGMTKLTNANLLGANLKRAFIWSADLQGADLSRAKMEKAELKFSSLRSAELMYANLCGAKLDGADLRDAKLDGANLLGANLENVRGDLPKLLEAAGSTDEMAATPDTPDQTD